MRIKHFQGYGCVNAKKTFSKVSTNLFGEKVKTLKIRVTGCHEYGLERDDKYDLYNWLVKRFDKSVADYKDIIDYQMNDFYSDEIDKEYGMHIEICDYTFHIKVED